MAACRATSIGSRPGWSGGGFSLVELLVVIGIIATLIAILLPGMTMARENAKTVQCLSNLRQLGLAVESYLQVSKGIYPLAYDTESDWDFQVTSTEIIPGILWLGKGTLRIQQCPSCDVKSPTVTDPYTGYNYNTSFIGHGTREIHPAPAKAAQIRQPQLIALFGDGQYWGGTDKFMRAPLQESPLLNGDVVGVSTRSAGTQGYRHRGMTNVQYCDGHAATVGQCYTKLTGATVGAGTGFLSADLTAYSWDGD